MFNKQNKLIISDKSKINFFNDSKTEFNFKRFDLKRFELILKNCRNITSIVFRKDIKYKIVVNIDSVFDLIINYCNKLLEIKFSFETYYLSQNTVNNFGQKFGPNLKKISFYKTSDNIQKILKFCPNLTKLCVKRLNDIFDGNEVLFKKLKSFVFRYKSEDKTRIESFIESHKNSLQSINVLIRGQDIESQNNLNDLFNSFSKLTKLKSFFVD